MALEDTRDGRDLLRLFDHGRENLDRLRAAMVEAGEDERCPTG